MSSLVPIQRSSPSIRTWNRLDQGNYAKIAREAGLTTAHVSRVLRGLRGASLHVAARIAFAAAVTLDDLYNFIIDENKVRPPSVGRRTRGQWCHIRKPKRDDYLVQVGRSKIRLGDLAKYLAARKPADVPRSDWDIIVGEAVARARRGDSIQLFAMEGPVASQE